MNFNDKLEERVRLDVSDKDWWGGYRFYFNDTYGRTLVHTEWAHFADILWNGDAYGANNDPHIRIIAWYEFEEADMKPSGKRVKQFYDIDKLVEAFKWLAENTH